MQIKISDNGWPGIFIPGDEALGTAGLLRKMASSISGETPRISNDAISTALKNLAASLEECRVEKR